MIDIALLRENPDVVKAAVESRKADVSVHDLVVLDAEVRTLQNEVETLRHNLKSRSKGKPSDEERAELQKLSQFIKEREGVLGEKEAARTEQLLKLPNINDPETPVGATEDDNVVMRTGGAVPQFSFTPRPYFELPSVAPYLHSEQGVHVSGARFYYLTGKLAALQRAVFRAVGDMIAAEGFSFVVVPLLVRERAMFGTGHFPAERNEVYTVNPGEDDLFLVGTAEVPLVSLHDGQTLEKKTLPRMYAAETSCFRREAGSYGKDQQGILRVHQFQKIEMVVFTTPDESRQMHRKILDVEEKIIAAFGLHYRVVNICTGDLGFPATQKFDIEALFPSQQKYRELTSTSNTTDYQTRRLQINYKDGDVRALAHTVNGTAATDRLWLAILEQHQQEDGSVKLPKILHKYLPWDTLEV